MDKCLKIYEIPDFVEFSELHESTDEIFELFWTRVFCNFMANGIHANKDGTHEMALTPEILEYWNIGISGFELKKLECLKLELNKSI